jgi:hypothetical protein
MPRNLDVPDQTIRQIERGESIALEVIDTLPAEELTLRENRRREDGADDGQPLTMAKFSTIKTSAGADLAFRPCLGPQLRLAFAQLDFVDRSTWSLDGRAARPFLGFAA